MYRYGFFLLHCVIKVNKTLELIIIKLIHFCSRLYEVKLCQIDIAIRLYHVRNVLAFIKPFF